MKSRALAFHLKIKNKMGIKSRLAIARIKLQVFAAFIEIRPDGRGRWGRFILSVL